jgi:hypothetical protein
VPATDVVAVAVLHDVTVARPNLPAQGVGTLAIEEVLLGAARPGDQLTLRWTEEFDLGIDPRAVDRRLIWFLRLGADGHAEAFGNAWHFAVDQCEPLRALQKRLQSFTGTEADRTKARTVLEWLRRRAGTVCGESSKIGEGRQLDPKTLARIEHEFTQPSCGLTSMAERSAQLDGLGIRDPMPYLVAMATKVYPREMAGLNDAAIALIGERADPSAQETLRQLYRGGALSLPAQLSASIWLASRFHDDTGLPLMKPRLRSRQAQVRADTLSYMGYVLTERDVSQVLPLASDKDVYVLERVALVLNTSPQFRRLVLSELVRKLKESRRDDAARIGFVLMLAGDTSGASFVSEYLLGYTTPVDTASLRQFVAWCNDLSRNGHRLGLDAVVHLFELNPVGESNEWLPSAIMSFAVATEFPHWWTHSDPENLRTAAEAIKWWKQKKDVVTFDPALKKFVLRSGR